MVGALLGSSQAALADPPAQAGSALSLEEAVQVALRAHPQVTAAQASADATTARIGQARAPWLPQLNHSAALSAVYAGNQPPLNLNLQLGASQLLYDFGRTGGRIEAAQAAAQAARWDADTTRSQIALSAVTAYYNVLQAEALLDVAARNLTQQRERLAQAESFFSVGTRPQIDVLTARTAAAQAQLQVVQNRNAIRNARVSLLQAMGLPATQAEWLVRPLQAAPPAPLPEEVTPEQAPEALVEQALSARPEVQALRERLRQAQAQVRTARGDFYPQLRLGANLAYRQRFLESETQMSGTVNTGSGQLALPGLAVDGGLTLSWPILTGLSTIYAVREAEAQVRVAQANLEALRQQVLAGLQQALINVQNAREAQLAAQAVLEQAEQQLQMASGRYQAGVGNIIELGDAQVGATTARAQRVQADYNLAVARAALRWQLGQLIPASRTR